MPARVLQNFTLDELEAAVDLAHSHGVSVYLALNIPIKQKELQHALEIVDRAYAVGIDAIILQDLGLLRLLKEIYPDLELHASTQMTIHNSRGVDFAAGLGATRVIVSRELTVDEVKDIVDHSKVASRFSSMALFAIHIPENVFSAVSCTTEAQTEEPVPSLAEGATDSW